VDLDIISREYPEEGHVGWDFRINLQGVGSAWDLLVIDEQYLGRIQEPVGRVAARVEPFVIVTAPRP
jgi:hypothetical protein